MNTFSIVIIFIIFLIENLFPFRRYTQSKWKHYSKNIVFLISTSIITGISTFFFGSYFFDFIQQKNIGLLNIYLFPDHLNLLITFLLFDLWVYWWHRINHEYIILWNIHRMHHNDPLLDVSTVFRFHPFEIVISSILNMIIILLIGIRLEELIIYKLIFHVNIFFHHSNIRIPERIDKLYRCLFVSPNMHRVHHSTIMIETNSNYSSVFSFWDRIFKSYRIKNVNEVNYGLNPFMIEKYQEVRNLFLMPFIKI